jgi:hypothetical protein
LFLDVSKRSARPGSIRLREGTGLDRIRTGTGSLKLHVEVLLESFVGRFQHCRCEFGGRVVDWLTTNMTMTRDGFTQWTQIPCEISTFFTGEFNKVLCYKELSYWRQLLNGRTWVDPGGKETSKDSPNQRGHILLQFPFTIIQRTNVPSLQPARNAVEVERML